MSIRASIQNLIKNLGPGLLFASTAIGTSHLVLSTKAGAQYGWIMVLPILLANIFKYPFFEFGVRYTIITNKTLIEGYLNRGKAYLIFYAIITLFSTFTILAALYVVTSGLLINLFGLTNIPISIVAGGLFILICILLIVGRYKFLEISLKYVVSILFLALLVTTILVIANGKVTAIENFETPIIFNEVGILFLIGLMGWMPTAVEASGWISLWSIEKFKNSKQKPTLKEALQEFNFGYFTTAILALFFMVIGWFTLYGTNTELSNSAVVFADQLVQLFTANIGSWAYILIAIAAFATMFSTCITAHDALARVSVDILSLLFPKKEAIKNKGFTIGVLLLAIVNFMVISIFSANMGILVALATFVSFVMAPIIGYMNLKNVMGQEIPEADRPNGNLRLLTYLGILFLTLFSIYYCWMLFF
ncbi:MULTISPECIES: NRAMP family divalent metal transporter [unclassified Arenibacter]|jgi:Mn2+/Fe2+ NRAMP family transporter|uniref:NRAMP family divalent metal transporter n=1 Tax=unclassified Arenibacter TaxID=2615047 RepID=UPI000E349719|nr:MULTISPECIES: divalent metal cation transporter [unclassified Arenibacter]MCM4162731.1 divalent metal cation transporter [Arenibacter sp. A80]RFT58294.1 divalent metal cation transporter [Arenibacter sp. P308M17]